MLETPLPPEQTPPTQKGTSPVLILLLAVGAPVLLLGFCAGAGYIAFIHELDEPVTQVDEDALFTVHDLVEWLPEMELNPAAGRFRKVRYLDGSYDVEFEYDDIDSSTDPLYFYSSITVEKNASDARFSYMGMDIGLKIGLLAEDGEMQQRDCGLKRTFGDATKCAILTRQGASVGNVMSLRLGRRILFVVMVGVYFDEVEDIVELLEPLVERVNAYDP